MRIFLHPDLHLQGRVLTDTTLGVRYALTADTAWLLRHVMRESRTDYLIADTARQKQVTRQEARNSLYALLGYVDAFGGMRIMWPAGVHAIWSRLSWRQRYLPTMRGFCGALFRAYGLLLVGTTLPFVAWHTVSPDVASLSPLLPLVVLASCAVHEAGHLIAVRLYSLPYILLARIGYAAVVYARPAPRRARVIASGGPLLVAAIYGTATLLQPPGILRMAVPATACIHLCSLLPFFADGKTLWRAYE